MAELEEVPPEILPPDEREHAAYAWALGAAKRGYRTIEEILADHKLKARILDDFDDEAADEPLKQAMAAFATIERRHPQHVTTSVKLGRNEPCPCGSGKKFKKCCLK